MSERDRSDRELDEKLIQLLEKQKTELVVRVLKQHEEAQTEKVFTDKIIANLSDLFFVLSEDFTIVKTNQEFYRSLGYSLEDSTELNLEHLLSPEASQKIKDQIKSGDFKNFETRLKTRSGNEIRVSLNGSTFITESGRVLHMMIATDKTDVYKMMSRIREAQTQLIHSGRLASLGEMAAGIGHELTQPLNAILLFARNNLKALDEPNPNKEMIRENLNTIIDRVKKASSIINSLKSFARKADEDLHPVEVNAILSNILKFLDAQLKLSDITVELELDEDLPPIVGHEVRLEQVFLNIIQNAVQAMGSTESPRLTIKTLSKLDIEPESLSEINYVVVSIKDFGEGIAPEVKEKIFNPFFTTREVGLGMGLGLSIVDRIVRSHSGFIKVDTVLGRGSRFSVFFPAYEKVPYE